MGFVESIKTCFSKYFVFSGRATRSELWYFILFWLIGIFLAIIGDLVLNPELLENDEFGPFEIIFFLVAWVPYLFVTFRRLHDVNRSGWWVLIPLTIIGIIPFYYWMLKSSDTSTNKYGPKPAKWKNSQILKKLPNQVMVKSIDYLHKGNLWIWS